MNSETMEATKEVMIMEEDTSNNDDALSLRDLQLYDQTAASSVLSSPRTSSVQEVFEFFTTCPAGSEDTMFCRKVIPNSTDEENDDKLNEYQKRDYLALVHSSSFRLSKEPVEDEIPVRSVSSRDIGTVRHPVKFSTSVKNVNITALTSMSSKSRRRMFMFGPVKFKPEMELSALRERQGRRSPSLLFPVAEGGDAAAVGNKVAVERSCAHKNHWGLVRTLRCRAHLNSVLARSFACIPIHRL